MTIHLKQIVPVVFVIVLIVGVIMGMQKGFRQSQLPLLDPSHPKVLAQDLPRVVLYSAEWCNYCKAARVYFIAKQVPFLERDIEKSPQAHSDYKNLGGQGIPLITINHYILQGFDKTDFKTEYLKAVHQGETAL